MICKTQRCYKTHATPRARESRTLTWHLQAQLPSHLQRLIDLLHLRALIAILLERRELLDIVGLVVVLDREAKLDHAVNAAREGRRLIEREARGEERRLEEQVDEVLDGLVPLVGGGLGLELLHDRVLRLNTTRSNQQHSNNG